MEYVLLTAADQATLYRGVLLQAEADHLSHSLEVHEASAALAALPAPPKSPAVDTHADARANATVRLEQRQAMVDAAESRATNAKAVLDDLKVPYKEPDAEDAAAAADAADVVNVALAADITDLPI